MPRWAEENPAAIAVMAIVLAVLALVFLALWLRSVRNAHLLSVELDQADRAIAAAGTAAHEQGARLRVIREVHDVAVQNLSAIVARSDAARYVVDSDPAVVARAAAHIGDVARSTLADLRRIVAIAAAGTASSEPAPGLETVSALITRMEAAGLVIRMIEAGDRFPLERGAESAVYRIVEEALANALEHGGAGTEATIGLTWTERGMRVIVDDNGLQAAALRAGVTVDEQANGRRYSFDDDLGALTTVVSGAGVSAMRARAAAFGGVFGAHPVSGVGFTVSATFPSLRLDSGVSPHRSRN